MNRTPMLLTLLAAAALAGCDNSDQTIVQNGPPDTMANELANAPPVVLPPAIAATKTYRCADNSLVTIDWLADDKTANVRVGEATTPVQFAAAAAGDPFKSPDGTTLTGTAEAASVTYSGKSCKA
ncbi:MAG TPA: hypothetical protein VM913_03890 [Sphingomicrobium sp.]|jgi:hypothetical protein|nr:hypothetical protein [Sphingomicrobium sp.]